MSIKDIQHTHSLTAPLLKVNRASKGSRKGLRNNHIGSAVPRGRNVSNSNAVFLGDYIDVKLAYAEYNVPLQRFGLSLTVGKFDSVLGYEYRVQESPDRITVTPSLICRYTCGRPLGLKARVRFFDERLSLNVALTDGSTCLEQ